MRLLKLLVLLLLICSAEAIAVPARTQEDVRALKDFARDLLTAKHYFASAIAYKYAMEAMSSVKTEDWLKQQIIEGSKRACDLSKQPEPDLDDVRPELSKLLNEYLSKNQLSAARSLPLYDTSSAEFRTQLAQRCAKLGWNQETQTLLTKASKKSPPGVTSNDVQVLTPRAVFGTGSVFASSRIAVNPAAFTRKETPEHMLQNAEAALSGNDLPLATDLFERVNQALYRLNASDPLRARALNGLISVSYKEGKLVEAAAYFDQLLPILENNYGPQDKDLAKSFRNYASLLRRLNKIGPS